MRNFIGLLFGLLFLTLFISGCGGSVATPEKLAETSSVPTPTSTEPPIPTITLPITQTSPPTDTPAPTIELIADKHTLGETWIRPADEMVMHYVPGGSFLMGSSNSDLDYPLELCDEYYGKAYGRCERRWWDNEKPVHEVSVNGFWIDETEVTNAHYRLCVEGGGCELPKQELYYSQPDYDNHPAVYVTWYQADAYCKWAAGRLPTEAEWEYAARGPSSLRYPWGDKFDGLQVNYCDLNCEYDWLDISVDDGYGRTAPVGSYPEGASWCGVLDLSGNVWEWVADWYDANYFAISQSYNPTGPETGVERVRRGGSWHYSADGVRGTSRFGVGPDNAENFQGFRCAITP